MGTSFFLKFLHIILQVFSNILFKKYLDEIPNRPESIVAISGTKRKVGDESDELIPKHVRTKKEMRAVIENFKKEDDPKKLIKIRL